jgi:hypothetical protein
MNMTRLIAFAALAFVFGWLALANLLIVVNRRITGNEISPIPLAGGLSGAAAVLAFPLPEYHAWVWLPLLADVGTVPYLVWAGIKLVRGRSARDPADQG